MMVNGFFFSCVNILISSIFLPLFCEKEEDDDLCLPLFDLCLFLGKFLLMHLEDVFLLSETQVLLGGAIITLGSDM